MTSQRTVPLGVGGGLIAVGFAPWSLAIREAGARGDIYRNVWFWVASILWILGFVILLAIATQATYNWYVTRRKKRAGGRTTPRKERGPAGPANTARDIKQDGDGTNIGQQINNYAVGLPPGYPAIDPSRATIAAAKNFQGEAVFTFRGTERLDMRSLDIIAPVPAVKGENVRSANLEDIKYRYFSESNKNDASPHCSKCSRPLHQRPDGTLYCPAHDSV